MALDFLNRCIFTATSGGTGAFEVASPVNGFLAPSSAGAVAGRSYRYFAQSDDLSQWEVGTGEWDGTELTRNVLQSSNSNAVVTFSAAPKVHMGGPLAQDMGGKWEKFFSIDFEDEGGPYNQFRVDNDFSQYPRIKIVCTRVTVDISNLEELDYLNTTVQPFDDMDGPLMSEESFGFGLVAEHQGGEPEEVEWHEVEAAELFINVGPTGMSGDYFGLFSFNRSGDSQEVEARSFSGEHGGQAVSFNSMPATPAYLIVRPVFWDESAQDYGTSPDFLTGTVEVYRWVA